MSREDYRTALLNNLRAIARERRIASVGPVQCAILEARFLPGIDRHSDRPRGRILDILTGHSRPALPGEVGDIVRRMSGGRERQRQALWDAVQRTRWTGGDA